VRRTGLSFVLAWLIAWCVLLALPAPGFAQAPPPPDPAALLDSARKEMEGIRAVQVDTLDDAGMQAFGKRVESVQAQANSAATAFAPELADVQARLAELGTPAEGVKESPDVAAHRAQLMRQVSTLDSQIKLARLLAVEAEQAAATATAQRRSQFSAKLGERSPAILGPTFWKELGDDLPAELRRFERWNTGLAGPLRSVPAGRWLAVAAAVAVLLGLGVACQRLLLHLSATRVPAGRLRRSLHAVGVVAAWTLTPGLVAHVIALAIESGDALTAADARLLAGVEAIVWFGGFTAGLGIALLSSGKPSWRLPPIPDTTASRLRGFPLAFGALIVLAGFTTRLVAAVGPGAVVTSGIHALASLTFILFLAIVLRRVRPRPGDAAAHDAPPEPSPPLWMQTVRTVAWIVLGASVIALLSGHVALGTFAVNQLVWGLIVLATAYLLAVLVDDLFMTLLAPTESTHAQPAEGAGAAPRTREQTAVLLSGLSRIVIGLFALILLLAPYGEGPLELLRRADHLNDGLSIGEISIKPAALLQGVLVLVVGFIAVRLLKDWLGKRYMPTTRMDAGMRLSVTTLFGYGGAVAVIAIAMSAVGVGLERVAWVASALSVGIGFGLQAVVQNFVSGLILLAERPVKVGDWVSLSGVEGDIRRINVRATEIQMGDRSTVIVPNSEFITKIVRNVTYTDPLGMVQIKLPMPLSTDTSRAREVLMAAFQSHPGVLASPAPNVQLDGIDGTNLVFNASGFVSSPRAAYGVRSDLLFDVLERLREAGLSLGKPPTMLVSQPVDTAPPAA
jgi:small-conductance mechanosensitive channel